MKRKRKKTRKRQRKEDKKRQYETDNEEIFRKKVKRTRGNSMVL